MKPATLLLIFIAATLNSYATNSDSASYYLKLAIQHKQENKLRDATASYTKSLSFNPADTNVLLEYGAFLYDTRKFMLAGEQYKKVLSVDASNMKALKRMVEVSATHNRSAEVMMYGSKIPESERGVVINFQLGKAYYYEDEYELSQQAFNKVLAQNPAHLEALVLLGKVYVELADYKKAIHIYSSALALEPNNPNMVYEFGLLHYTLNLPKEAVKYFELAASKGYKVNLDFTENLGLAYLAFDVDKGVEVLGNVLQKKPNNPEIQLQIANAYYRTKSYSHAADRYYKMYEVDPTNTRALYMMGMAYQRGGDKAKGINICEQALRMDGSLAEHKILGYSR